MNGPLAQPLIWHRQVRSTMDIAAVLARNGAPHGTVVWADEQIAGRGRHGRSWMSAPRCAMLTSWILRYEHAQTDISALSPLTALAVARAIARLAPNAPIALKWPNDILLGGRKVAGILLTSRQSSMGVVVIAGIGVNLFTGAVPEGVKGALLEDWYPDATVARLIDEIAETLGSIWSSFGDHGRISMGDLDDINDLLAWRDELVVVQTEEGDIYGAARGVAPDGALLLQTEHSQEVLGLRMGEIVRGPRPAQQVG